VVITGTRARALDGKKVSAITDVVGMEATEEKAEEEKAEEDALDAARLGMFSSMPYATVQSTATRSSNL